MNNRTSNRPRTPGNRMRPRTYPRHFSMRGQPILGVASAINLVKSEHNYNSHSHMDELKVGDMVIVGEKEITRVKVAGEEYYIAYRNKLVKVESKA